MSASATHNDRNVRRTVENSLADFRRIVALRDEVDPEKQTSISSGIAKAFGCTIQGKVPEDEVLRLATELAEVGADRIGVADTVGYASPDQVARIFAKVRDAVGSDIIIGAHFHDTRLQGTIPMCSCLTVGAAGAT